jgi:hypothetical protein
LVAGIARKIDCKPILNHWMLVRVLALGKIPTVYRISITFPAFVPMSPAALLDTAVFVTSCDCKRAKKNQLRHQNQVDI